MPVLRPVLSEGQGGAWEEQRTVLFPSSLLVSTPFPCSRATVNAAIEKWRESPPFAGLADSSSGSQGGQVELCGSTQFLWKGCPLWCTRLEIVLSSKTLSGEILSRAQDRQDGPNG